jgi:NAD+ diphosphatase
MVLPFSGSLLSCSDELRDDDAEIEKLKCERNALFLPFFKYDPPVTETGELFWISWDVVQLVCKNPNGAIFLGLADDHAPRFAIDIGESLEHWQNISPHRFEPVRSVAAKLAGSQTSLVAKARSILKWIADHRFCSQCGSGNSVLFGGYRLQCTNLACGALHFPRIDPVVIMMVVSRDNSKCLLGRSHDYPERIIAPLAGFMEPGESIEDAINREVREEVGISCTDIEFWGNQPWPFPSSLMLGCFATAVTDQINLNHVEMAFADWFTRSQLEKIFYDTAGNMAFPDSISISYHMMRAWMMDDASIPHPI